VAVVPSNQVWSTDINCLRREHGFADLVAIIGVMIALSSEIEVGFLPHDAQGLEAAEPADLDVIEISPAGL
jgi:hypothetical protein